MSAAEAAGADAAADRRLLLAACFLRATATALGAVLLAVHLARAGFEPAALGLVSSLGLAGAAAGSLLGLLPAAAVAGIFLYRRLSPGLEGDGRRPAGAGEVGLLFFAARLANVASHFGAAWLARRFGLVNTMVFTHLPSSLLLVAVAFVPSFPWAAGLFLLRECLVEMDVPTRGSYVMALVAPLLVGAGLKIVYDLLPYAAFRRLRPPEERA